MKKSFVAIVLLGTLVLPSYGLHASTVSNESSLSQREMMLKQIQELMVLIKKLQAQLQTKKQSPQLVVLPPTERVWLPATKPTAQGTLLVEQVAPTIVEFSGVLTPSTKCTGAEQYEFVLEFGNGESKTYTPTNCTPLSFTQRVVFTPSRVPVQPVLILRSVDTANNVWMNYEQERYLIDLTNPIQLNIKRITSGGKG